MLPRLRLAVLSACLLSAACGLAHPHIERPVISVRTVQLKGGNLMHQNLAVTLHVENPNDRDLPVRAVHADLTVEGDPVASGDNDRPFVVPARGAADVDVTVSANLLVAAAHLGNHLNDANPQIDYEVTGTAQVDMAFVGTLPFHQSGSFPLNLR